MEEKKYVRATIRVEKNLWEMFKRKALENESDASKEVRKFIKKYLKDSQTV